ncbi:hypothetical protein E2C01_084513 [Portunus trituberculatus]|uniref:Uncharacterized protein n=1 Tax=Portunus trituberculatus TaxID=210409 RepID=A0A5B7J4E1_PORTR|nr:hypothetical protein [Portunus trituberculatus]
MGVAGTRHSLNQRVKDKEMRGNGSNVYNVSVVAGRQVSTRNSSSSSDRRWLSYQLVPESSSGISAEAAASSYTFENSQQNSHATWSEPQSLSSSGELQSFTASARPRRLSSKSPTSDKRPRSASVPQSPSALFPRDVGEPEDTLEYFPRSVSLPEASLEEHVWEESGAANSSWNRLLLARSPSSFVSLSGSPSYVSLDSSPPTSPPSSPNRSQSFNMPRPLAQNVLMRPLVALALPGMYLVYKYNQYKRQQQEANRRKAAERELVQLHHKIVSTYIAYIY